jgi:hypothetical protein
MGLAISVQSGHLMDGIELEAFRLGCPGFTDVFVGRETEKGLEPAAVVVG